jgi:hypothetical protein
MVARTRLATSHPTVGAAGSQLSLNLGLDFTLSASALLPSASLAPTPQNLVYWNIISNLQIMIFTQ